MTAAARQARTMRPPYQRVANATDAYRVSFKAYLGARTELVAETPRKRYRRTAELAAAREAWRLAFAEMAAAHAALDAELANGGE